MTKQNYCSVTKSHIAFALQRFNQDTFCFEINEVHNTQVDKKTKTNNRITKRINHNAALAFFKRYHTIVAG